MINLYYVNQDGEVNADEDIIETARYAIEVSTETNHTIYGSVTRNIITKCLAVNGQSSSGAFTEIDCIDTKERQFKTGQLVILY
jgi:hypothetical protein